MKKPSSVSILALLAAVLLFGLVAVSSVTSIRRQSADAEWVEHTQDVLEQLETTLRFATEARRGAMGYVATGDMARLRGCFEAHRQTELAVDHLSVLTADDPAQQVRLGHLKQLVQQERAGFDLVGATRSVSLVQTADWRNRFVYIRGLIDTMKSEEQRLLAVRNAEEDASVRRAQAIVIGGDLLAFALVIASLAMSAREGRQRREADARVSAANRELTDRVFELQQRSSELSLLSRLGQLLQSCEKPEEAGGIVRSLFADLFPRSRGSLYTISASRNLVIPIGAWPESDPAPEAFAPADCWALRSGSPHHTALDASGIVCKHAPIDGVSSLCIPLLAQGEALGLLSLRFPEGSREAADVAAAAAEQLSLAISNLTMQESLRRQAMRDPLTGLFNRRYMEETLDREIHRALRQASAIAVLLIDVDHFKQYNDTFGHTAGDDLLRSAADVMQRAVRAEDVACRYGGDEFVVIMPDAQPDIAEQRARDLHSALAHLPQPVTASIGVALFPADGATGKDLLLAADGALYQAKRAGRARVVRLTLRRSAAADR